VITGTFLDQNEKIPWLKGEKATIDFNIDGSVNARFNNPDLIELTWQLVFSAGDFEIDYGTGE